MFYKMAAANELDYTLVPHGAGGGACSVIREVLLSDGNRLKGCDISYIEFEPEDLIDENSALIVIRKFHPEAMHVDFSN